MSRSIIQNAFQALASSDPDRITAVLTEDAEWLSPPGNATAVALEAPSHMMGRKAIVRFFAEDYPRLFARDDARQRQPLHQRLLLRLQAPGGLIHRVREYVDTARGHRMIFDEQAGARQIETRW